MKHFPAILISLVIFLSCSSNDDEESNARYFYFQKIEIGSQADLSTFNEVETDAIIKLTFSSTPEESTLSSYLYLRNSQNANIAISLSVENKQVTIRPLSGLEYDSSYRLVVSSGMASVEGEELQEGKTFIINTVLDLSDKFPRIPDDDLLDLVQSQTFRYFWDMGDSFSGMARERTSSGNLVTTGGTGFGIMAMIVAAQREFISRNEALERIQKIVSFLDTRCTRYHGAFAHWINGQTGETIAFSEYDDGADLVETSFLFQGLLTARNYFDGSSPEEASLREDITRLWEEVEWTWFRKDNENVLYWHWSPRFGWQINMQVSGWNEALMVYLLAAASPTYPIDRSVYDQGWARNGNMKNGNAYYGFDLPLGDAYGGPLFFSHYSFLGLNPHGLTDQYANYWEQNRNHTLINYNYCIDNPKGYRGYGTDCWGLTASDGDTGYSAHSPTNDRGVITPSAALSSMPYTPEESMQALHFFYYKLGDKLWSDYGFYDAFNLTQRWYAEEHLAIDQGPIVIMIENMRTGLVWNLFMMDEDVKTGLQKLGFSITD